VNKATTILDISASGRTGESVSRQLSGDLVSALEDRLGVSRIIRRDLNDGIGFVDEAWIAANLTPEDERTPSQRERLAESDALIAELKAADVIVIGTPMYNFGVPATLKAWIDQVARARVTFRYTENGPVGLLEGKKAYLVLATGGVPVDAPVDFATPYLRHALGFIGISDVDVIAADRLNFRGDEAVDAARATIAELVYAAPRVDSAVA
jgi:FMN-dependent NADH-azoreductase